jgi:SPP1 gp7 family putative phage head morphogenesis protein
MNLDAARFLESLTLRHAKPYFGAVQDLFVTFIRNNRTGHADARNRLAEVVTETMGVAEVLGASLMLRTAADLMAREKFSRDCRELLAFADAPTQSILPRVTLTEAVEDMVARTPATIRRAAERTASRIAELYGEGRVVAFARAAEAAVTRRAQKLIAEALREGIPEGEAGRRLRMGADEIRKRSRPWSEGYAQMAFRTNVNTAVTAGRFRQAQDPDIREVVPAFRFDAVGDADTRPNHEAADGVVLDVTDPQWARIAPPLGYNCRCQVSFVSRPELAAAGRLNPDGSVKKQRVPAAARPDPGFRHTGRPDLFMVQHTRR